MSNISYPDIIKFEQMSGIPGISVSSTYRAGSRSNSGNLDYHSQGEAVDFTGSPSALAALAAWFKRFTPNLLEEIYSGPGAAYVKNGRVVPSSFYASELSGHTTHVHIAMSPAGVKAAEGGGLSGAAAAVGSALPAGSASVSADVTAALGSAVAPLVTGVQGIAFKVGFAGLGLGLVVMGLFLAAAPGVRKKRDDIAEALT